MFLEITKAEYITKYMLRLWFNNGAVRTVDLYPCLNGEIFEPLKDIEKFKNFSVKYNTVEWGNGADFAPEYLYDISY